MSLAMNALLKPYGKYVKRFFNCEYTGCEFENDKIKSITVSTLDKQYKIFAKYFVDCSSDVSLVRDASVEVSLGTDSKCTYNEASCMESADNSVNGVTQMFVVKRTNDPDFITEIPDEYKNIYITEWKENVLYNDCCIGFFNVYPDLSISINMLPTMDGRE